MQQDVIRLDILNPRGKVPHVDEFDAAHTLESLSGKRIAILNNTKAGGEQLLPYVLDVLKRKVGAIEFREWRVPFMLEPEQKAPRLQEIVDYADGVIALTGD